MTSAASASAFHGRAMRQAVSRFRDEKSAALPLHPLERALVVVAGAQLCFMPWALGSMVLWAQLVALGLAVAAFALSLITRHHDEGFSGRERFRLVMWRRLVRFPLFWIGLVFLGYIALQGANPSWRVLFVEKNAFGTVFIKDHIRWLPTGVAAPFGDIGDQNTWRVLIIYGEAWLLACALWVGLTRRRAVVAILTIMVVNAALIGLVAFLQRVTDTGHMLWIYKADRSMFVGSILYKNHAGAFFNMALACALALGVWHYRRAAQRMVRSGPTPLFGLCALIVSMVVVISYSRTATVLLVAYLAIVVPALLIGLLMSAKQSRNLGIGVLLGVLLIGVSVAAGYVLRYDKTITRLEQAIDQVQEGKGDSLVERIVVGKATFAMARDRLWTGWGSGSFMWVFPLYQQDYPEINWRKVHPNSKAAPKKFWRDAHNDYAQLLMELGVIGVTLGAGLLITGVVIIIGAGGFRQPHILLLVGGLVLILIHGWVDCHTVNPAVLCTFSAILILAGRWAQLEQPRSSRGRVDPAALQN